MRANNLTLLTDLYELTMMQGYFKNPTNQTVIFDMFYRNNPCGGSFAITNPEPVILKDEEYKEMIEALQKELGL